MQAYEFTKLLRYFFKAAKSDSISSGVASSFSASPLGSDGDGVLMAAGWGDEFDFNVVEFAGDWLSFANPDFTVANSAAMSSAVAAPDV
jgi:hypothetical protein